MNWAKRLHFLAKTCKTELWIKNGSPNFGIVSRRFGHNNVPSDPQLSRKFLAQLWIVDKEMEKYSKRRTSQKRIVKGKGATVFDTHPAGKWFSGAVGKWFPDASVTEQKSYDHVLQQPPPSQSLSGLLEPAFPEEARVAPLLARSNLLITRDIEWANLVLGFEQGIDGEVLGLSKLCLGEPLCSSRRVLPKVSFIREQSNLIARQLLRLRRPFVAYITDAMGNELFRVSAFNRFSFEPWTSCQEVGVVHRRWHLWRRIYDLYLGNKQFAVVENPGLWNWTFTLKDIDGNVLAQIDRDWRGFGFEIFTDAGQYVIRFGSSDPNAKTGSATVVQDLEVIRPLTLAERAVAVALAISLDNDYFSRHGGMGIPFVATGE
ncbi:unnamed protein product [Dovyalis caffra]|uniref:Phospholipid scramblase n=1 Tax=Dovyalis caffra TaxID=77055 RepID=A0AAV1R551_9ROSI|nr:unnamed protein product [Dovyalis caffra]